MVGDPALAEDLAQEAFVKAFRSLATFDPTRRLSSWIFRIAHNTALDALRKARPRTVPLDAPEGGVATDPAAPLEADPVVRRAMATAIQAALGRLRPEYRAVFTLRYEEGLAFDEIGRVLGVAEATARSHAHRGRKELLLHLTTAGWGPDSLQRGAVASRKPE